MSKVIGLLSPWQRSVSAILNADVGKVGESRAVPDISMLKLASAPSMAPPERLPVARR